MRTIVALALLALAAACDRITGPDLPGGAYPMDPVPEVYETWWRQVMRESGITRDVSHVRWLVVPGGLFWSERERAMSAGRWVSDGRIYMAEGWETYWRAVMHEMLHEVLQGDYEHAHPLFQRYRTCQVDGLPSPCVTDP